MMSLTMKKTMIIPLLGFLSTTIEDYDNEANESKVENEIDKKEDKYEENEDEIDVQNADIVFNLFEPLIK